MIEKQGISDDLIISCLNINYGIEVASLLFLPLGADINASVYKVHSGDQISYFVKIKRGRHHDVSIVIAELLQKGEIQLSDFDFSLYYLLASKRD